MESFSKSFFQIIIIKRSEKITRSYTTDTKLYKKISKENAFCPREEIDFHSLRTSIKYSSRNKKVLTQIFYAQETSIYDHVYRSPNVPVGTAIPTFPRQLYNRTLQSPVKKQVSKNIYFDLCHVQLPQRRKLA